jgi:hypothetical protein
MDGMFGDHLFALGIQEGPQCLFGGLLRQEAGDFRKALSPIEHGCPEIVLCLC